MANRAAESLALPDAETARLQSPATALGPADLTRDALRPGRSVAQVLTLLARNTDALLNLNQWAVDERERAAYPLKSARDAESTEGVLRSLADISRDGRTSAERFREEADVLLGVADGPRYLPSPGGTR